MLTPLLAHLRRILSEAHVKQTLAAELNLPARSAELLLAEVLVSSQGAAERLIEDFLREAFVTSGDDLAAERTAAGQATADVYAAQFQGYAALWKAATIATALELSADDLAWLRANGSLLDLLDFNDLPSSAVEGALQPNLFAAFERLLDIARLRKELPPGEATLFELIEPAIAFDAEADDAGEAVESFLERLHARTGWDLVDLAFLASPAALDPAWPDDYRSGDAVRRLIVAIRHLERLGVSASRVVPGWTSAALAAPAAQQIKAAAKAKFDEKQWLRVAEAVNDELREKQRDALLGFLIADEDRSFETATDVYARYLIDPQMSACMLTSRIKQAISSVQLFVQRVLLNLEGDDLSLSGSAAETWNTWMKHYRLWEANRKVFLYPENWIEPELRDDKSPFFEELENELLQGEITQETRRPRSATTSRRLNEVARLEVAGVYNEVDDDNRTTPATTSTRCTSSATRRQRLLLPALRPQRGTGRHGSGSTSTSTGDHVIPVVLQPALHLFWPVFTEKPREEQPAPKPATRRERHQTTDPARGRRLAMERIQATDLDDAQGTLSLALRLAAHPAEPRSSAANRSARPHTLRPESQLCRHDLHSSSWRTTCALRLRRTGVWRLRHSICSTRRRRWHPGDRDSGGRLLEQLWNPRGRAAGFTEPLYRSSHDAFRAHACVPSIRARGAAADAGRLRDRVSAPGCIRSLEHPLHETTRGPNPGIRSTC